VASRDAARADAYAREHGFAKAHGSYEAMLADPEVDAVYISLPNSLHVVWSIRALESGKHVLCEKPLTRIPDEAERAFDVAEREGLVLMEGFMYRHHPQTKRLAALVTDGAIGDLRAVRASFTFNLTREGDVRLDPALAGGSLMDVGCYCVNMVRMLAGEPTELSGAQSVAPTGVDVRFAGVFKHQSGVLSHFDCGFDSPLRQEVEVVGSEGSAFVRTAWLIDAPGIELRRGDTVEWIEIEPLDRYMLQWENFAAAVAGTEPPLLDRADALGQARTLDSLYRAAD
jgi:D-xylose 1-dehydrogenase (NADP+, D-xylono-1,5-lactone-forming)